MAQINSLLDYKNAHTIQTTPIQIPSIMDSLKQQYNVNNTNSYNLTSGMSNPNTTNSIGGTPVDVGEAKLYNISGISKSDYPKLGIDPKNVINGKNGQVFYKQDQGFMQKYGQGIQVGLGIGQLGLGLASYLDNHKMMKQSIENMQEQLKQSREEYARLNNLRHKLTSSYNSK